MAVTPEILDEIALTREEYDEIVTRLGREPNGLELGLFGALWSEHCGYKHSRPLLRLLPSKSPRMLVEPGAENAGVVDLGNGDAVVFKIESHNHPSAIEPFQGAATGVGGIVRDILTMAARPIALLNSLRFGPPSEDHQRYLIDGVVRGISWYGNCIGVPDVGGEIAFAPAYAGNPLVNAMCVGLVSKETMVKASASGEGNLLLLVGSETGRDGIHGASGLASRSFETERELRPTVQVGNPFLEKVLIEACLEVVNRFPEYVVGMQDLGAAGLTSSVVECAERGDSGVKLDVAKVPRREAHMTPYEVMLSESQERMLLIIPGEGLASVRSIFEKWDLTSTVIGEVVSNSLVTIFDEDSKVAEVPVKLLTDPPQYRLQGVKPGWLTQIQSVNLENIPEPSQPAEEVFLKLLSSPNIASRAKIFHQYDYQVGTNTVVVPGMGDAAVLRLPDRERGIALSVDGNGRFCQIDPFLGGAIAVAESCRNLVCVGAEPIAITDCLNFGNPENLEVYYQMEECIKGIAAACEQLGVPVVSGNVSLYNESSGRPIYPTPVIGSLGLIENVKAHCRLGFHQIDDLVLLLGESFIDCDAYSLSGSELQELYSSGLSGRLSLDLDRECKLQRMCRIAISEGLLNSAHDCSEGGLGVALAEACIVGGLGFFGEFTWNGRWDAALFGESQSRIIVSVPPDKFSRIEKLAKSESVPICVLGRVAEDGFKIPSFCDLPMSSLREAWENGLTQALSS